MKRQLLTWAIIVLLAGCESKLVNTDKTTQAAGVCDPKILISSTEENDAVTGFFSPADSVFYQTRTLGLYYQGGATNPCSQVVRVLGYKNPISTQLRVVWLGPKGSTTDKGWPRAQIRFTDKAYQDDIDRSLPDGKGMYPFEILVREDSTYVNLPTNRDYKIALRKGYSNEPNEVKCAEVSLSATPFFDAKNVILSNDTTRTWSERLFLKPVNLDPTRKFIVVREKECVTCPEPVPVLSTSTPTISLGEEVMLNIKGCRTITDFGQGPLEWSEQVAGSPKKLIQRFSYSATDTRRFSPKTTTTYFLRCQGEWYCKPTAETSITIQVR